MLGGKISIDLQVKQEGHGSDDCGGATLKVKPEHVESAVGVAVAALDQMGDVARMVEVIKIDWRERALKGRSPILVLCFWVIMVEPSLPASVADLSTRREPEKFRAFISAEVIDNINYLVIVETFLARVGSTISQRAALHRSATVILDDLAKRAYSL